MSAAKLSSALSQASQPKPKTGKDFTAELKKEMQKVRDVAKKSEKYLAQLERDNFTVESLEEYEKFKKALKDSLSLAESCIEKLMSEQGNAKISNIEVLLDKMLGF